MTDAGDQKRDDTGGGDWLRTVPRGDDRERLVCPDCGLVNYQNPKIVVGAVAVADGRILLCRRAIAPRRGYWTLPAGYLENHETVTDGAQREAHEEARARIGIDALLAVYNIPRISQVQLIYRARLENPESVAAGEESEAVALFDWAEIPWETIAFPSVHWALNHWRESADRAVLAPYSNPEGETGER